MTRYTVLSTDQDRQLTMLGSGTSGCTVDSPSASCQCPTSESDEDAVDDGLDSSIHRFGLVVDDAGFGAGICTALVDTWSDPGGAELDGAWSGPGGAELDDACASDDSA
jgi:hypothetical protein